ncbi:UbiA family prenyltransferase [Azoarcus olearius]|uniref:4-hydroxybenzoate octaprenyltransferase n=1 Tax=Azoarcus sp. (strain BH72) TaxID=418699 RepID=A1K2B0_AZOSB|nr:UbiA family prenyltransferase [Azoarcus olearius]CAL92965.1 4-hydroxybenzoate octaprenyltransferase [Azoarcus olearius]
MENNTLVPLVVDLDGTLTPTDTLVESGIRLIKQSPLRALGALAALTKGKAALKDAIAAEVDLPVERLPYREPLLDYLREQKAAGRKLVLATAAHCSIADKVAGHLGLFEQVLATRPGRNLKGSAKLAAIRSEVGTDFVYAGDCRADLPIWKAARAAVLVAVPPSVADEVRRTTPVERDFAPDAAGPKVWARAFRVHQWLKNLLLFVPLFTAFSFFDLTKVGVLAAAFVAFSLAASATYVVNDLWDLDNDRVHPRKRARPFASARIPILQGLGAAAAALAVALGVAWAISPPFLLMLLAYLVLTSAYSWVLKEYVLIDVLMLSLLYTLRIIAGSVASGIVISSWLLAFSVFLFLSLALVKRCSELVSLEQSGGAATRGRDYRVTDLVVLWQLGVGAALSAVVVFGLFITAPDTVARYGTPHLLWAVAMALTYWLARLWIKTSRGEMHDDPVVYAIKDRGSRVTVSAMVGVMAAAHYFRLEWIE